MRILVSACLLGCSCRYDGKSKPCEQVIQLAKKHTLIPVCPEQLGGLPTPRPPAEIQGEKVMSIQGKDVTLEYRKGAEEALQLFRLLSCDLAILKSRSPSCGLGQVYDGTFSGSLRPGSGITAALFHSQEIPVLTEENAPELGLL